MTNLIARVLLAVSLTSGAWAPAAQAQVPSPPAEAAAPERDCSRWPGSVFDAAAAVCVCPPSLWWNLRGESCLPREHAATEFCTTVWPSSSPYFVSGGGYRCVCAPPMLWNAEATACRPPVTTGDQDCQVEWPGTLPVLSPSGTEFECRCPGGQRWDETRRSCVAGAPVVKPARGFYDDGSMTPPAPVAPAPDVAPGGMPPDGVPAFPVAPGPGAPASGGSVDVPAWPTAPVVAPSAPPTAAVPRVPSAPVAPRAGGKAVCDSLIAEIRGRAAAGQTAQADQLGMRAAVSGCDPTAIADAARTKPAGR